MAIKKTSYEKILDLKSLDLKILKFLGMNKGKKLTVKDLVEKTKKDRTTVQKSLKERLIKKGYVKRFQRNLDRGYDFGYELDTKSEIENNFKTKLKSIEREFNKEMLLFGIVGDRE